VNGLVKGHRQVSHTVGFKIRQGGIRFLIAEGGGEVPSEGGEA